MLLGMGETSEAVREVLQVCDSLMVGAQNVKQSWPPSIAAGFQDSEWFSDPWWALVILFRKLRFQLLSQMLQDTSTHMVTDMKITL